MYKDETDKIDFIEKTGDSLKEKIDEYDANMLSYLGRLYESLNGEKLDFDKVKNAVDALKAFDERSQNNYLSNLLHPEKEKGVKIPSAVPVPSSSFQLHNSIPLTTNSSGNLVLVFNPYFLYDKKLDMSFVSGSNTYVPTNFTSLYVYNNNDLTGSSVIADAGTKVTSIDIGQGIPNVYSQYRLVSASLVIKYIGRMDITSGVIGGAIIFDEQKTIGGTLYNSVAETSSPLAVSGFSKYTNFDIAMDSFYHQENLCIEGIRQLYFPLDNSFEEYVKLFDKNCVQQFDPTIDSRHAIYANGDYYKTGFNQMVYVMGAPPNSQCFKLDVYCNFECLPNPEFLNYMPVGMPMTCYNSYEKQIAIKKIQEKPISKANEITKVERNSIWDYFKQKFYNKLPAISKLVSNGIIGMIPSLKPIMGIAGSLVSGRMSIDGNQ